MTLRLSPKRGRVLLQAVVTDINLPPFDHAEMDSFAPKAEGSSIAPVKLRLIGGAARASFSGTITVGQPVKIMSGAQVHAGAHGVQQAEGTGSIRTSS
ncbi:MAG TPA: hypothetical protein VNM72_00055 [Blastocatellia bacterium]|nr:hypothetical protein [Blastocatellia bacterium]